MLCFCSCASSCVLLRPLLSSFSPFKSRNQATICVPTCGSDLWWGMFTHNSRSYPMDLGTIQTKLFRPTRKTGSYDSVVQFRTDVIAMLRNCLTYNNEDTPFYADAEVLATHAHGERFPFLPRAVLTLVCRAVLLVLSCEDAYMAALSVATGQQGDCDAAPRSKKRRT